MMQSAKFSRFVLGSLWACLLLLSCSFARAETSFYSVTGISTRVVSNAVQLTIQTDGAVDFGADLGEVVDKSNNSFDQKSIRHFRLRLLGAHAKLPAFNEIGVYPVDAAVVSLGQDNFQSPYFNYRSTNHGHNALQVDVDISFYVPVTLERLDVGIPRDTVDFRKPLQKLFFEVTPGPDRKSIVITVISDRTDPLGVQHINRTDPKSLTHAFHFSTANVNGTTQYSVNALHTSLAEMLVSLSPAKMTSIELGTDAAATDVSLNVTSTGWDELFALLIQTYDLSVERDSGTGIMHVDRGRSSTEITSVPLLNLSPDQARLLFPDFLLPNLRADESNHSLDVVGSQALAARIAKDISKLDRPRPNVKIVARIYSSERSTANALSVDLQKQYFGDSLEFSPITGSFGYSHGVTDPESLSLKINGQRSQNQATLVASPFVVVASGATGHLFAGQQRFVQLLSSVNGQQTSVVTPLSIGYTLDVTPLYSSDTDVTLRLSPQTATVDDIDPVSRLPILGATQLSTSVRVPWGKPVFVSGLDLDLGENAKAGFSGSVFSPLFSAVGNTTLQDVRHFVIVVTAERA